MIIQDTIYDTVCIFIQTINNYKSIKNNLINKKIIIGITCYSKVTNVIVISNIQVDRVVFPCLHAPLSK